ncbi:uncharacterized protein KZ484_013080 [Pholidichthys leucotaenia]
MRLNLFTFLGELTLSEAIELAQQLEVADKLSQELDFSQQPAFSEEDVQPDQGLCNQERNTTPDREKTDPQIKVEEEEPDPQQIIQEEEELEPTQIKEEEEDVCASHEGELLVIKLEADTFTVTPKSEEMDHNEVKANGEQLLSDYSAYTENKDEEGSQHVDSGSSDDNSLMSKTLGETETGAPQLHNCKEEEVLTVQQSCNQETSSNLKQEEHASQVKEQLELKQETDTSIKYTDSNLMKQKMKNHHKIPTIAKSNACSICGKNFERLQSHMRIHTDSRASGRVPC